jgi:uncharacterized protein (TIGR01777 family)
MKFLISGGSGLIGKAITRELLKQQHAVAHLSRNAGSGEVPTFGWDIEKGVLDMAALQWQPDVIINLAGASINKRWTPAYKSEIVSSRVQSTRLLFESVQKHQLKLSAFVSASAVGYYPNSFSKSFTESASAGSDFLSEVCIAWEREAQLFEQLNIRTAVCRVGIVLAKEGGALPEIIKPIKFGVGAPLASGEQWMAWIHLEDVARVFIEAALNQEASGPINAVGPYNVTNKALTHACAKVLHKPLWMPHIPGAALKLLLGEMAATALSSNKAENTALQKLHFHYHYSTLEEALQNLLT